MENSSTNRFLSLDALRGIAALGVALSHYSYLYDRLFGHTFNYFNFKSFSSSGVELFFILSGFVIFYSLQKISSTKVFLIKRFIRLFPTYWACVLITFTMVLIFELDGLSVSIKEALINLTMIQQLFHIPPVDRSYWTLIPELFFYLMMAGLFMFGLLKHIRYFGFFWIVLSVIHTQFYHIRFIGLFMNLDYVYFFYTGIVIYLLKEENIKDPMLWLQLGICFILSTFFNEREIESNMATAVVFGIFILFLFDKLTFLSHRYFVFLGSISYAWYLLHQNIGYIIINLLKPYIQNNLILVVPLLLTGFLAFLTTKYLEKPTMHTLKKKLL